MSDEEKSEKAMMAIKESVKLAVENATMEGKRFLSIKISSDEEYLFLEDYLNTREVQEKIQVFYQEQTGDSHSAETGFIPIAISYQGSHATVVMPDNRRNDRGVKKVFMIPSEMPDPKEFIKNMIRGVQEMEDPFGERKKKALKALEELRDKDIKSILEMYNVTGGNVNFTFSIPGAAASVLGKERDGWQIFIEEDKLDNIEGKDVPSKRIILEGRTNLDYQDFSFSP